VPDDRKRKPPAATPGARQNRSTATEPQIPASITRIEDARRRRVERVTKPWPGYWGSVGEMVTWSWAERSRGRWLA
jgi:hypothetical protein